MEALNWIIMKMCIRDRLYTAFEAGDAAKIEQILNQKLLDAISYHDDHESFYHGFLMALLSSCETWYACLLYTSSGYTKNCLKETSGLKNFLLWNYIVRFHRIRLILRIL